VLARRLLDPLVVHARRLHLDRPGHSRDLSRLVIAVAHHQAVSPLVLLAGQPGYIGVDFGLQRGGPHPPRALADDLIDQGGTIGGGAVGVH